MPSRRKFLCYSAGTIILVGISIPLKVLQGSARKFGSAERELFMRISVEYFKLFPEENKLEFLKSLIPLESDLPKHISEEFGRGDFVSLSSWNLSKTEARLISYLALRDMS